LQLFHAKNKLRFDEMMYLELDQRAYFKFYSTSLL
jgi:hypothetical protein